MLKLLKPEYHSVLGIDISSTSVNIVEISGKGEARTIEGYGNEALPPNSVEGHVIKDIDAVAQCIRQLIIRARLKSKFATLAVPDSAVISKILQVNEDLNETEIEEFIILEADKYIPYPIEEINIDFEIIGPSEKNPAMLDVLIVASRTENVSSRVDAAIKAGLQVKIIDVESFAIERALQLQAQDLPSQGANKVIAVIDIRDEFTNLYVLHNMKIIYSREDEFGGKQLLDDTAQYYGISRADVIQRKANNALPEDYEEKVVRPFIETFLVHIKRSLQFFFSTSNHGFVDQILLAGSIARLGNLANLVQERSKITTSIVNPAGHLNLSGQLNKEHCFNDAPSLLIACGLALRQVD